MSSSARLHLVALVTAAVLLPFGCGDCGGGVTDTDGGRDASVDGSVDADDPAVCGDNVVEGSEACDDGDTSPNDGCSGACQVETGWTCPSTGGACTRQVECGNAVLESGETCDDGDTDSADGCSATCQLESGWSCAVPGTACSAARCGDGLIAGAEECDDGDADPSDGCSAECRLEPGYKCPTPGAACETTQCGDGITEGTEQCDDGDNDLGDGCTPLCTREPVCSNGTCTAVCGDGVILPGDTSEACDDGNSRNGDGCSSTCTLEQGFECELVTDAPPSSIEIPVVYRDFIGWDRTATAERHQDFENKNGGVETGLVQSTLDAEGKPVFAKAGNNLTTAANFAQWYRDVENVNLTVVDTLVLNRQAGGEYVFDDQTFFPLNTAGWVAAGKEPLRNVTAGNHNFSFTSEARYWFEYKGTEVLQFRGDDDVWVFINGRLAVDIGGVHGATLRTLTVSDQATALGLEVGKIYEVVVFQAERHTTASSYRLTLSNFTSARSQCVSLCGNGTIDPGEECDDGNGNNEDTCLNSCRLACQALSESCSPSQGCCGGLTCVDQTQNLCDGTTPCVCEPEFGSRPRSDNHSN